MREGEVLIVLDTNELELKLLKRENDLLIAKQEIALLQLDDEQRPRVRERKHQLHEIEQEIAFLKRDLASGAGAELPHRSMGW